MFSFIFKPYIFQNIKKSINIIRNFSLTRQDNVKITLLGSSGGIGQPLGLLLKYSPLITRLNLYDIAPHNPGVAADLSHIETKSMVCPFTGPKELKEAVKDTDIIICCAGLARKPNMTRDDLFDKNATIVKEIADISSKCNPEAYFLLVTNPINSNLPIACEIYKKNQAFDPRRMFGITTLDVCRANNFVAQTKDLDPTCVEVPVICGHSAQTIIPVLCQTQPKVSLSEDNIKELTTRIRQGGDEVVKAKAGLGSATLSMAYSAARFTFSLIRALEGECIIECTMIKSDICPAVEYFANPVRLGKCGVEKNLGLPKLSKFEEELLKQAVPVLQKDIKKGKDFACGKKDDKKEKKK